jgi:methionyl aminopeptidase
MSIETTKELEALKRAGRVTRLVLEAMRERVAPGITTRALDEIGAEVMIRNGGTSAPRSIYKFPAYNCISLNDQVVHGVPDERPLQPGDLVKLDATVRVDGFIADAALTLAVPPVSKLQKRLIQSAETSFFNALAVARVGHRVRDIGRVVEQTVKRDGFRVVRDLVGHGVGRKIHEDPSIPNFYDARFREPLKRGMVFTIEPMVVNGSGDVVESEDGWAIRTADKSLASHFEHTIVITDGKPILLTA